MDRLDPMKIFYHTEKLLELKQTGDTWPVHMQIGLTSVCNHQCIFCHGGHSVLAERHQTMDFDVLMRTLRQAKAHGLKAVTLVGNGEPLCYPRIDEVLAALKELGLEIGIFTNGALLNETRRKFVVENCTFIRFSVNGGTPEAHAKVHQVPGDFDRVVSNVRALVQLRNERGQQLPTIGAQMVFYEDNYRSVAQAAKLWKEVGVDYFEIKPYVQPAFHLETTIQPAQDQADVLREMEAAKAYEDDTFKVYAKYTMYQHTQDDPSKRSYARCLGQAISSSILEGGEVVICPHFETPGQELGNINEQSFEDIWTGERRKKLLAAINVKKCPGGCRYDGFNEILWDYLHPQRANHPDFI